MKTGLAICILSMVLIIAPTGWTQPQPPDRFELFQNAPDPFCPAEGVTEIQFTLPVQSPVSLEVWNPDTTAAVRTLVYGVLMGGYYTFIWDGADDGGSDLPSGSYPYSLTATDPDTGDTLFQDMLIATIDCSVETRPGTWGGIKAGTGIGK